MQQTEISCRKTLTFDSDAVTNHNFISMRCKLACHLSFLVFLESFLTETMSLIFARNNYVSLLLFIFQGFELGFQG
jgi:hypothetical protein